jgi:hypothetical protein
VLTSIEVPTGYLNCHIKSTGGRRPDATHPNLRHQVDTAGLLPRMLFGGMFGMDEGRLPRIALFAKYFFEIAFFIAGIIVAFVAWHEIDQAKLRSQSAETVRTIEYWDGRRPANASQCTDFMLGLNQDQFGNVWQRIPMALSGDDQSKTLRACFSELDDTQYAVVYQNGQMSRTGEYRLAQKIVDTYNADEFVASLYERDVLNREIVIDLWAGVVCRSRDRIFAVLDGFSKYIKNRDTQRRDIPHFNFTTSTPWGGLRKFLENPRNCQNLP